MPCNSVIKNNPIIFKWARIWTCGSWRKIYHWPICTWHCSQYHSSSGKSKLKSQWYVTPHLLEWIKFKRLAIVSVDMDANQLELLSIVGGVYNGIVTWGVCYNTKHFPTFWASSSTFWYYSKEMKTCP